jgi:hypothetical protein
MSENAKSWKWKCNEPERLNDPECKWEIEFKRLEDADGNTLIDLKDIYPGYPECGEDLVMEIKPEVARKIAAIPTLESQLAKAITALEEISEGKGEYNREPLIHARNTIESMKALASTTLAELKGE